LAFSARLFFKYFRISEGFLMFKKHIAIHPAANNQSIDSQELSNGNHNQKLLKTRQQTLEKLFITPSPPAKGTLKNAQAIHSLKQYSEGITVLRNTNIRLSKVEELLKKIFRFQSMGFAEFYLSFKTLFNERFKKLPSGVLQSLQKMDNPDDSDSEETSSEQVSKTDVLKLLRLYLRLSIRKKELEEATRHKPNIQIIGYPKVPKEPDLGSLRRDQKENKYSEVEAYVLKISENSEKLVLSKSSWLYQRSHGHLMDEEKFFFDTLEEVIAEKIHKENYFSPHTYTVDDTDTVAGFSIGLGVNTLNEPTHHSYPLRGILKSYNCYSS